MERKIWMNFPRILAWNQLWNGDFDTSLDFCLFETVIPRTAATRSRIQTFGFLQCGGPAVSLAIKKGSLGRTWL